MARNECGLLHTREVQTAMANLMIFLDYITDHMHF